VNAADATGESALAVPGKIALEEHFLCSGFENY